ncbi:hypothetical protein BgiBS90_024196 [Biomphalaria glabrata]|nr:hypothetical protein BgiBS90_024196 [Biomphalaria glabrata]
MSSDVGFWKASGDPFIDRRCRSQAQFTIAQFSEVQWCGSVRRITTVRCGVVSRHLSSTRRRLGVVIKTTQRAQYVKRRGSGVDTSVQELIQQYKKQYKS